MIYDLTSLKNNALKFIPLDSHSSFLGLVCIGGIVSPSYRMWLEDGKILQRNFSQGNRVYSYLGKAPTLNSNSGGLGGKTGLFEIRGEIRKLKRFECEKLQTVPSGYTNVVSESQAIALLGNGWTIEVIAHIFNNLKTQLKNNMNKGIKVLSLFDGMSCGQIALERSGIKVDEYYASEVDKHAIKVTMHNYPNTIQLGSVTEVDEMIIPEAIDLLIGGSPCQSFSFAGKMKGMSTKDNIEILSLAQYLHLKESGFEFEGQSYLFWEYVRILTLIRETNPEVKFLLENVKMVKKWEDLISEVLGVRPIKINSALVSAQNRQRLYWTNIEGVEQPEDRGILLKDIVHENCETFRDKSQTILSTMYKENAKSMVQRNKLGLIVSAHEFNTFNVSGQMVLDITPTFNVNPSGKGMNGSVHCVNNCKSNCLTTNKGEGQKISVPHKRSEGDALKISIPEATKKGFVDVHLGDCVDLTFINSKTRRGRLMLDKSNCLTAASSDFVTCTGLAEYIVPFDKTLQILEKEVARGKVGFFRKDSQANRVYYIHGKAVTLCGEAGGGAAKMGQYLFGCITPERIEKRQNGQRFSTGSKFYTLTAQDKHGILIEGYIRKLTPIECERLQTVVDDYTACVSNSQRYRMLGNGWTVDVVAHIFNSLQWKQS